MYLRKVNGPRSVALPDGRIISQADLPPEDTVRWVASRKAIVVLAVQNNLLSRDEALERYALSDEEFSSWEFALTKKGLSGLKVTRLQRGEVVN